MNMQFDSWNWRYIENIVEFLLFSTIFCYLPLDCHVWTGTRRFSLRDKRLFEITEIEVTRVDCINEDAQEIPQSRNIAVPKHQKKKEQGTNNKKQKKHKKKTTKKKTKKNTNTNTHTHTWNHGRKNKELQQRYKTVGYNVHFYLKRKAIAPKGRKFFRFRVEPY